MPTQGNIFTSKTTVAIPWERTAQWGHKSPRWFLAPGHCCRRGVNQVLRQCRGGSLQSRKAAAGCTQGLTKDESERTRQATVQGERASCRGAVLAGAQRYAGTGWELLRAQTVVLLIVWGRHSTIQEQCDVSHSWRYGFPSSHTKTVNGKQVKLIVLSFQHE